MDFSASSIFARISSIFSDEDSIFVCKSSASASRREISASTASYSPLFISILSEISSRRAFKSSSCLTHTAISRDFFLSDSSRNFAAFSD